jgi:hypothetical protein
VTCAKSGNSGRMEPCVVVSPSSLPRFTWLGSSTRPWPPGSTPRGRPAGTSVPSARLFGVSEHDEARVLDRYRWGLVPSWAKDPKIGNRLFNARAEGVAEKPSFRSAFANVRASFPSTAFTSGTIVPDVNRQPHFFTRVDEEPLLFAGLYEYWRNPEEPADPEPTRDVHHHHNDAGRGHGRDPRPHACRARNSTTSRRGSTSPNTPPTNGSYCYVPRPREHSRTTASRAPLVP